MSTSQQEKFSWIKQFCCKEGNELFCEVDESYIRDYFNLHGLREQVFYCKKALLTILGEQRKYDNTYTNFSIEAAQRLYGLIHARYILTDEGIKKMMAKSDKGDFGICPRYYCQKQPMLPIGLSDIPGEETVKLYCARCMNVFHPTKSIHRKIDGVYFGRSFPHMVFMVYPERRPEPPSEQNKSVKMIEKREMVSDGSERLFGFRIHPLAYEIQHEARRKAEAAQGNDETDRFL